VTDVPNSTQGRTHGEDAAPGNRKGAVWRALIIAAVLIAAVLTIHLTPIREWLKDAARVRQTPDELGPWVYPVTIIAVAALVSCGVPRLLFCALGGMLFGFWLGLLLTQAGTLLGHYCVFLFIRWGGRDWVLNRWPKLNRWADLIHEQGVVGVILIRQLPAHAMLTNLCLGLSHVKHRHFLIGTAIGLLPEAIPVTLVGAGLVKASLKDSAGYLAIAAGAFALIWIGGAYALKAMRRRQAGSEIVTGAESINEVKS
jgi:uncharacterized membrane protein YdjX (TVP38/TMEM64 family)